MGHIDPGTGRNKRETGKLAKRQLGKAPPSGPMVQRCPFCTLKTQGGNDGLAAHIRVIHPDREER